ncbi:ABC-type transport auxiliary lipoprotein family protein [Elioraea sp.]|uniref:ABC-type transport auxiliary lipoprotein family protein n=1 Tax=Elioraea sp. TaxID=2185103 RepID=UPI0025B91996|nr:ABC-type transport auxiliary lipoprotein family protein [Elioraea sp.]
MTMTPRRTLLLAAPALLAACANPLTQPFPDKRLYVLDARRPQRLPANPRGRVLVLRSVTPASGAELRGIVTRLPGGQQRADFWNEFFAAPASLVQDQLRQWLADSGLFAAVVDQGTRTRPDLALETVLGGLFGDATETPAVARAQIQSLVLGLDRTPPRVIAQGDHDRRVAIASLAPEAIVAGLNVALAAVFADIEASFRGRV